MKKLLLSVIIGFSMNLFLNAQITVTDSDFAILGDLLFEANDSMPNSSIVPGGDGEQTWDFSSLVIHTIDTSEYIEPSTTPNGSDFPNSNTCAHFRTENTYAYLTRSSSSIIIDGVATDIDGTGLTSIIKDPTELIVEFPLEYGDVVLDSSAMTIVLGTYRMVQNLKKQYVVNAWGNITIPMGTYEALRVLRMNIETQVFEMDVLGTWTPVQTTVDTTYSYEWWTNNDDIKLTVCSFDWNIVENKVDGAVTYYTNTSSSINKVEENSSINIYPNPNSGIFNIEGSNVVEVNIVDVSGKLIYSKTMDTGSKTIDLSSYSKGLYFIKARTENDIIVKKIMVN